MSMRQRGVGNVRDVCDVCNVRDGRGVVASGLVDDGVETVNKIESKSFLIVYANINDIPIRSYS